MRYETITIQILGSVLGTGFDGEETERTLDRSFRPQKRPFRRPLEELVIEAYQAIDESPNSVVDAGSGVVITRRSKATGATRTRRFPLRRFTSIAYLLDLPDADEDEEEGEEAF